MTPWSRKKQVMVRNEQLPENAANVELLIGAMNKFNS
jgi:hypothetical protein